ncbi:hypothetical protein [Moorena sp. SIO3F7]|uniref:hypothetical protein n=1 Tax=unclassified Moorena TaxID=2683338 RepID=UPI0014016C90|nr:IS1 family transposase [Moorena sp. SIO3E8]NEQ03601.1 IS1 family transposase [Moorena sp. SIO3F7]
MVKGWHSFWYVTDKYVVYQIFIDDIDHFTKKNYMTALHQDIESENTKLRHYLARLHRRTLC